MSRNKVIYAAQIQSIIRNLPPLVKKGIRNAIDEILKNPDIGKPLSDELFGLFSHQFKRYRVVYRHDVRKHIIEIVFVGHRYNIYDLLSERKKRQ